MPRKPEPEEPLYVKLPAAAVAKLDRAAETLGVPKKELIAGLVTRYVDPDSPPGLAALGQLAPSRPVVARLGGGAQVTVGAYSFQPNEAPEVLTAEQAADLLQLAPATLVELAEAGEVPGRRLGIAWRFSRTALLAWLGAAGGGEPSSDEDKHKPAGPAKGRPASPRPRRSRR